MDPGPVRCITIGTEFAAVTGCTDGIGKAVCEELAKLGINLVLISRTKQKLDEQAKELQEKFKIDTRVVPLDFSVEDPSAFNPVKSVVENLDVGILGMFCHICC